MYLKNRTGSLPFSVFAIPAAIATVVVVGILLHFISDAFLTFVAALFLANIFMPLVEKMRKLGWSPRYARRARHASSR